MFLQNINVFEEVIKLAKEITILKKSENGEEINKDNLYEVRDKESDLIKYLNEQDYEILKDIITVMYIGVDMDHDKEESPKMIFDLEKMFLSSQGWAQKEILIYTISCKSLLDEFLKDGLKVLNIEI